MTTGPLHGPAGLFTVDAMPRFVRDSARVGWQGAFFTHVVGASAGRVDQAHSRLCVLRTLDPIELRGPRGATWCTLPPTLQLWRSGDEQRGDWRGRSRGQFLFIDDAHVEQVLDGRPPGTWGGGGWVAGSSGVAELALDALDADLAQGSPAGPLVGDALVVALIALTAGLPPVRVGALHRPACARVIEYIDAHLHEPLSLAGMARLAGLGMRHFSRAFRTATGESPHQYVIRRRIERAKVLIARGLPLAEVALRCGFADQSQFTRAFGQRVGITPARYRARLDR